MDFQHPSENFFHALRNKRIDARNALSDEERSSCDERLAFRVEQAVQFRDTRMTPITRLLNRGASLAYDSSELDPDFGDILDLLDRKRHPTCAHRVFNLLENIIASASDSWATNIHYVGTGGWGIPPFLAALVATGDVWGIHTTETDIQMHHRHHAWSVLQRMVWAYERDRRTERYPICCTRLVTTLLLSFLFYVSKREGAAPLDSAELQLFDNVVAFFRTRTTISKTVPEFRLPHLTPLSTVLLWRINPRLFQTWYVRHDSPSILNTLLCDHAFRKSTLNLLAYESFRAIFLQPNFIRDLCRRKERVIFVRLYHLDPQSLMHVISFALQVLESKLVRGRKERLIAFFKGVQDAR